ncbi:MAG: hypothetical protein ABI758_00450 [Candidatus Woesebacteria bacterium]
MRNVIQKAKSNWPVTLGILALFIYSILNAFFAAQQRAKQLLSQTIPESSATAVPSPFSSTTDNFKIQFPSTPKEQSGYKTFLALIKVPYNSYESVTTDDQNETSYTVNVMTLPKEMIEDGTTQERSHAGIEALKDKDTTLLSTNEVTFKNKPALEARLVNTPNKYYFHIMMFEQGTKRYTLMTLSSSDSSEVGKDFFESFEFLSNSL